MSAASGFRVMSCFPFVGDPTLGRVQALGGDALKDLEKCGFYQVGAVSHFGCDLDVPPVAAGCARDGGLLVDLPGHAVAAPCSAVWLWPVVDHHLQAELVGVGDTGLNKHFGELAAVGFASIVGHVTVGQVDGAPGGVYGQAARFAFHVTLPIGAVVPQAAVGVFDCLPNPFVHAWAWAFGWAVGVADVVGGAFDAGFSFGYCHDRRPGLSGWPIA